MTSSTRRAARPIIGAAPAYRLAALVRERGGMSDAEMIRRAKVNVERVRVPTLKALDREIEGLSAHAAGERPDAAAIYKAAVRINEIAAAVGFQAVGLAAFSLCDLLDGRSQTTADEERAILLHVATLRLLRSDNAQQENGDTLLQGLRKVVARAKSQPRV